MFWVRQMRSPQAIGVELRGSGSGTFHFTCSVALQVKGRFVSVVIPVPSGPRHAGQFAAKSGETNTNANKMRSFMRIRMGSGKRQWNLLNGQAPAISTAN